MLYFDSVAVGRAYMSMLAQGNRYTADAIFIQRGRHIGTVSI